MTWTSRRAASLASYNCFLCHGKGIRSGADLELCDCVYRTIFRRCHAKFRSCVKADPFSRLVTFDRLRTGVDRRLSWARRNEDFCADFHAAGLRVLSGDHRRFFSFYHLQGARRDLLLRRLGVSPRTLDRLTAEVELAVGCQIAHMQPYSLFPPQDYMKASVLGEPATTLPEAG